MPRRRQAGKGKANPVEEPRIGYCCNCPDVDERPIGHFHPYHGSLSPFLDPTYAGGMSWLRDVGKRGGRAATGVPFGLPGLRGLPTQHDLRLLWGGDPLPRLPRQGEPLLRPRVAAAARSGMEGLDVGQGAKGAANAD